MCTMFYFINIVHGAEKTAYYLLFAIELVSAKLPDLSFETGLNSEIVILTTLFIKNENSGV